MNFSRLIFICSTLACASALPLLAVAQTASASNAQAAADPKAAAPAVTYRSVFRETSLGVEQEKMDWRKANDDVGKFTRGHVDILKQEEMDSKAMDKKAMDAKAIDDKKSTDSKAMPQTPPPAPASTPAKAAPASHKH